MPKPAKIDVQRVIDDIASGISVVKACKLQGCSSRTFYDIIETNPDIKQQYTRACEDRGASCLDRIEETERKLEEKEIDPQTARVIIDTEKWKACKFYPKMFGDKQSVEVSGTDGASLQPVILNICPVKAKDDESK